MQNLDAMFPIKIFIYDIFLHVFAKAKPLNRSGLTRFIKILWDI